MLRGLALTCILWCVSGFANASATPVQDWIAQAHLQHLATSSQWLKLVHYRPNILLPGYTSFATGSGFFLAANGRVDPQAELDATLRAIALPATSEPDAHAQCRFIARFHWLKQALAIPDSQLPHVTCKAFDDWYHNINPARVTLVFPSAYINNPSSMFGHTLLRIDPPKSQSSTALTSYSISYAAETTEFNGLVFAIKGLTGGYHGFFSIQPYYDKVNEYSDLENRDIWEYELNFTPEEIRRMMEHAWELHKTAFDYYFLDENCSFQLLALLDVARPGMNLTGEFPLEVIPVDTIRAVLKQRHLLAGINYRPASRTNLSYWLHRLHKPQQDWILAYSESDASFQDPRLNSLSLSEQAEVLDVAYQYVQYQYRRRLIPRKLSAEKSLELLTRRSRISDTQPLPDAPRPATRPDQGHLSSRFLLGYGELADRHFTEFTWRPAYHDLLDNDQGHVAGSQINFLNVTLRKYTTENKIELERFDLIDIFSITPTNRFFHALSWHFDTGFERLAIDTDPAKRDLVYTVKGGAGYTYAASTKLRGYAMLDASAIIHHDYTNSVAMGIGARAGLLWQIAPWWKLHLEAKALDIRFHADRVLQSAQIGQSFVLGHNDALRLNWQRTGAKDHLATEVLLSWNHYY
jgi:hypothetical protein